MKKSLVRHADGLTVAVGRIQGWIYAVRRLLASVRRQQIAEVRARTRDGTTVLYHVPSSLMNALTGFHILLVGSPFIAVFVVHHASLITNVAGLALLTAAFFATSRNSNARRRRPGQRWISYVYLLSLGVVAYLVVSLLSARKVLAVEIGDLSLLAVMYLPVAAVLMGFHAWYLHTRGHTGLRGAVDCLEDRNVYIGEGLLADIVSRLRSKKLAKIRLSEDSCGASCDTIHKEYQRLVIREKVRAHGAGGNYVKLGIIGIFEYMPSIWIPLAALSVSVSFWFWTGPLVSSMSGETSVLFSVLWVSAVVWFLASFSYAARMRGHWYSNLFALESYAPSERSDKATERASEKAPENVPEHRLEHRLEHGPAVTGRFVEFLAEGYLQYAALILLAIAPSLVFFAKIVMGLHGNA